MLQIPKTADIMTSPAIALAPDMTVMEAASILIEHKISGAPVVDEEGNLIGLLSEFDCIEDVAARQYHEDHDSRYTVRDLMTPQVLTVSPETDLFGAASEIASHKVRRLPVVKGGQVVGILSRRDILKALFEYMKESLSRQGLYPDYPQDRKPIRD